MATGVTDFTFALADTPGFREFAEVPNYSERKVIFFASPYANTQAFFKGAVVRAAVGSGTGTESTTRLVISIRTASGSGTGTESATAIEILPRSATGSGQGTSGGGATGLHIAPRTATGSGVGTDTNVVKYGAIRNADGSGLGTAVAIGLMNTKRTATGSGAGTQTGTGVRVVPRSATGSGTGTQTATQKKLLLFLTPTDNVVRYTEGITDGIAFSLFKFYEPMARGRNVYKFSDGSFTENDPRDLSDVVAIYYGGTKNFVSEAEKADLVAAGYTVT
jgi:hypothetical protein